MMKPKLNSYWKEKLRLERARLLRLLDVNDINYNLTCKMINNIEDQLNLPFTQFLPYQEETKVK